MGRKLQNPKEGIRQKSVGFRSRQWEFFFKYPDFRPDQFCRKVIDEQIAIIDPQFLEEGDIRNEA